MDESPGALLTYYNDGGGGGGGRPSVFFGSEILAKSDIFGSMKDTWIFLGCEEKQRDFFWVVKKGLRDLVKKVVIFLGRQILKF